jgi:hypothetical protein
MQTLDNSGLIDKLLNRQLSDEEKELFRQRFESDDAVKDEVRAYSSMIISLRATDKFIKSDIKLNIEKADHSLFRVLLLAASVALIIGIGFYYIIPHFKGSNLQIASKQERPVFLLAENFQPNPTIENALKQNYRSTTVYASFKSPSDSISMKKGNNILFSISTKPIELYNIILFDNKLKTVLTLTETNENSINLKINLAPGLYYWKYESASQSKWGGKILILP